MSSTPVCRSTSLKIKMCAQESAHLQCAAFPQRPNETQSSLTLSVVTADHLKLNFPMAWAASVLAWGFIEFQDVSTAIS